MPKAVKTIGSKTIAVTAAIEDDFTNRAVRGGRTPYRFQFDTLSNGESILALNLVGTGVLDCSGTSSAAT